MSNQEKTVVVLGASQKRERYSNKAIQMLIEHGYHVIPIHPVLKTIEDLEVRSSLDQINESVHTLTVYVGPKRSATLINTIVQLRPDRIILNPGTESDILEDALDKAKIPVVKGCTLVMLQTSQF